MPCWIIHARRRPSGSLADILCRHKDISDVRGTRLNFGASLKKLWDSRRLAHKNPEMINGVLALKSSIPGSKASKVKKAKAKGPQGLGPRKPDPPQANVRKQSSSHQARQSSQVSCVTSASSLDFQTRQMLSARDFDPKRLAWKHAKESL